MKQVRTQRMVLAFFVSTLASLILSKDRVNRLLEVHNAMRFAIRSRLIENDLPTSYSDSDSEFESSDAATCFGFLAIACVARVKLGHGDGR